MDMEIYSTIVYFLAVLIVALFIEGYSSYTLHLVNHKYIGLTNTVTMTYNDYLIIRRCLPGAFYSGRDYVYYVDLDARKAPTKLAHRDLSSWNVKNESVYITFESFWEFLKFHCREVLLTTRWKEKIPLNNCSDTDGREWIEDAMSKVKNLCKYGYPFRNGIDYLENIYVYYR